jgi:hypothetical protein
MRAPQALPVLIASLDPYSSTRPSFDRNSILIDPALEPCPHLSKVTVINHVHLH